MGDAVGLHRADDVVEAGVAVALDFPCAALDVADDHPVLAVEIVEPAVHRIFSAAFTRTAALELAASAIRVNAICPGVIDTPAIRRAFSFAPDREPVVRQAIPLRRFGRSQEIARAILFLASDDASYVTGATLVADGGLTAGTGIPDILPFE